MTNKKLFNTLKAVAADRGYKFDEDYFVDFIMEAEEAGIDKDDYVSFYIDWIN